MGVVGGAAQEQATQGTSRRAGKAGAAGGGVSCLCESSACGGVCDGGACMRACAAEGRGQVVLARGGGCVRACECVEAGWRLTRVCGCLGGGLLGLYVAGWGQVRRGLPRRQNARARHLDPSRRRQVSAAWVWWQGRGSSRSRQSTSRRAGEAGAAGGGVCVPARELSVRDGGAWLARLRSRGERAGGVGARLGLCEGMRERGGGAVTDGGLRVVGRGSFGVLCCGVGAGTKGTTSTASATDEASTPGPTETGECGVGVVAGARQQQAAAEHEPVCGRGGCGRGRGVRACERAQRAGARVMAGCASRACAAEGRGQVVLARGGGCVRACESVEAGR